MRSAPLPPNETQRLTALRQTGVLDTEPEECFDRLTDLAARLCGAPIALITLVDVDRQWFKSHVGLQVEETPRDVAFCAHAILHDELMVVRDALEDERFADNPLVTSFPEIRFYAGSPLITHDGQALGTFCIIDTVPRDLDDAHIEVLETLSNHALALLELRRTKELLKANAEQWERAGAERDAAGSAAALERLGDNLEQMIEAREQAETSFRELERKLHGLSPSFREMLPEVHELLTVISESSDHVVRRLGSAHPVSGEVSRIASSARRARELVRRSTLLAPAPPDR